MGLSWHFVNLLSASRIREIEHFRNNPHDVQHAQLKSLLRGSQGTVFGRDHSLAGVESHQRFASLVPVCDYDAFRPYIERMQHGEANVASPGTIKWFAKSSGTTGSKSKFIPVSDEGLRQCHMRGPLDTAAIYAHLYPGTRLFDGKTLTLGGSHRIEKMSGGVAQEGDLSAILIENTPKLASFKRAPKAQTALIPDFEQKVKAICEETLGQDIRSFAGVPSWNMVLMNRVLEYSGKSNIMEVWPNMELFIHGGMNFTPYREAYKKLFPSDGMRYMETYNASEGFFAIADDLSGGDMLLMLDYGVYYEFIPMSTLGDTSTAVPLEGVSCGVNYAMVITTVNGLWRYMIGDTVEFTSISPYRIKITGRTKHFINAFGEEIIIDNAESALKVACEATGAMISDYTAAPVYMEDKSQGGHQWVVEFSRMPSDVEVFTDALDCSLQDANSDYEAKRFKNTTLQRPTLTIAPTGTFYEWMKLRGKAGGQNKVPRLFNDRTYVDELLEVIQRL